MLYSGTDQFCFWISIDTRIALKQNASDDWIIIYIQSSIQNIMFIVSLYSLEATKPRCRYGRIWVLWKWTICRMLSHQKHSKRKSASSIHFVRSQSLSPSVGFIPAIPSYVGSVHIMIPEVCFITAMLWLSKSILSQLCYDLQCLFFSQLWHDFRWTFFPRYVMISDVCFITLYSDFQPCVLFFCSELARIFSQSEYKEDMKQGILIDLYYYTIQFCRDNSFSKEQTSALFSIVKQTHEVCVG